MNRGYRKYITPEKNDSLKRARYEALYSDRRILEDVFPNIEKIEIFYTNTHKSIFGNTSKDGVLSFSRQNTAVFAIPCLNNECSYGWYYDLRDDIYNMRCEHLTEYCGEKDCQGQEAPDHPEQSCGGSLKYKINIVYK
jgi:hypothetical protein